VHDDLRRSRLTVLLRGLLVLPHLAWLVLWGIAVSTVAVVLWLAVVIEGRVPLVLHDFVAGFVRYSTHVGAYLFLAANPYPGFLGRPGYPVELEVDPPARQGRLGGLVRLVLAIPAVVLATTLAGGPSGPWAWSGGVLGVASALVWLAAVATGKAPRGLRDLVAYAIGYGAQTAAYALLLTGRYPDARPGLVQPPAALPSHPVRLELGDTGRRSRLTAFFRPLLALPHAAWLLLWGAAVVPAVLAGWLAALATGRLPVALHRFVRAYVRYLSHVTAFATLVGGPFPGFTGAPGSYPVEIAIDDAARQRRLAVAARLLLVLPALLVWLALTGVLGTVAVLGWLAALATASMPRGLLELGAISTRYQAQTIGYLALVTGRYPNACPAIAAVEPEEVAAPT
jgi:hypothetical protein